MKAGLTVNGVTVLDKALTETWSCSMFNQRVLKKFGDELIKDMVIDFVNQATETTNELFSAAIQRDTPETGYEKFHLNNFKGLKTPMEKSVLQRVAQKLTNVKDFKVRYMVSMHNEVRCSFVDLAADVIEQHESVITDIDFFGLIESHDVSESDQRLGEVLFNYGQT